MGSCEKAPVGVLALAAASTEVMAVLPGKRYLPVDLKTYNETIRLEDISTC
jgi:hypothetical protein